MIANYIKVALKVLTRRKVFTFISLFGITLTLVVLVVATAVLDDAFSTKGPEKRFDRALVIYRVQQRGPGFTMSTNPGYGFLRRYVLTLPGVERATAFTSPDERAIYRNGGRIDTRLKRTDANYWQVLDFRFLEGRPFSAEEEARGALVAVITDDLRERVFDGAPAAGKKIEIDGQQYTVVGVVPSVPMTRRAAYSEIWTPITTDRSTAYRDEMTGSFNAALLLGSADDRSRVKQAFADVLPTIPVTSKEFVEWKASIDTPFESVAREMVSGPFPRQWQDSATTVVRIFLTVLALLFMTLPALNLVTLNLSRILERAPEIGVRKAFGARRHALVSQFVMENVVLTVLGGLAAYALASVALVLLNRSGLIPHAEFALNLRVFIWGMFVDVFFGVFSGAYPAWRMSRLDPVLALRGGAS